MSAPLVKIQRGLPASGKSTEAKQWVGEAPESRARVNRDDLRFMLFGNPDYSNEQEKIVSEVEQAAVRAVLKAKRDVVIDATHLRPQYIRAWRKLARSLGADTTITEFPIDVDEAIARDAARDFPVGEAVIRKMARKYLPGGKFLAVLPDPIDYTAPEDLYVAPEGGIPAVIVDIDGTVAKMNGRGPYDLHLCGTDLPREGVIESVRADHAAGFEIIFLSGREEAVLDKQGNVVTDVRAITQPWLDEHVGVPGALHMRAAGDGRKDFIVKRELFDAHVRHKYDVRRVYDDRNQVIRMWDSLGLTVFDVDPMGGDF